MNKLTLDFTHSKYDIFFEKSFDNLINCLNQINAPKKLLIVTETNVDKLYSCGVMNILKDAGFDIAKCVFEAGEINKNINSILKIYQCAIDHGMDRTSMIIALGGGVVGDMAGYAAATYMRGIRFVGIPTTLLSQVDSSVGGKTGFDFADCKNIIGAFHQPSLVYINVNTLQTLSDREFTSGMGEVIKHSLISDEKLFNYLDENCEKILKKNNDLILEIVKTNCKIKANVVLQDEKETGLRANLNFGHTIGHAIESANNFSLTHGECVGLGMLAVYNISNKLGITNTETTIKVENLLKKYNFDIKCPNVSFDKVYDIMTKDKKKMGEYIKFILPTKFGEVVQRKDITKDLIEHGYNMIVDNV